jgi:hypothetical protein
MPIVVRPARARRVLPVMRAPLLALLVLAAVLAAPPARADADKARAAFLEGTELVAKAQWGEALAAFERAREERRHPITTYNMAACERAMGRYTRARRLYLEAIAESDAATESAQRLSPSLVGESRALVAEIERLLVRVTLSVEPAGSSLAVDGRPLTDGGGGALVAGLGAAGAGAPTPSGPFVVLVDPGRHVLLFARRGFRDVTVARTFEGGRPEALHLVLTAIPATLRVSASERDALVAVDGVDVGPAPVDVLRPAGAHRVVVRRDGFVPYDFQLQVGPGEETALRAELAKSKPSLFSRWWFWTAAGVVVAGAAATTYLLVRPGPTRGEVDGGTTGWRVDLR